MQALGLLMVLHHFADVQKLQVDGVHIHIFALVFLETELRLPEGGFKDVVSIVLHSIFSNHLR